MKKARDNSILVPLFNEFIYTLLYQTGVSVKRLLKGKYQSSTFTEAGAKRFIKTATREEKELLLSELGFSFYYIVLPKNLETVKLKEIFKKFKNKQKASGLDQMAEEGMYIIGDEQLVYYAGLMTKSIHQPVYFLNLELIRQGYNISQWEKRLKSNDDLQSREAAESDIEFAKLTRSIFRTFHFSKTWFGFTQPEIIVLIYFYIYKHKYLSDEELKQYFIGILTPMQYRYALKGLLKSYCIEKDYDDPNSYSIATPGIRKVIEFRDKVLSLQ